MPAQIDILTSSLNLSPEAKNILHALYLRPSWRFLACTEEYRCALDVIKLRTSLQSKKSLRGTALKSNRIKHSPIIAAKLKQATLDAAEIRLIKEHLEGYADLVEAVMLTKLAETSDRHAKLEMIGNFLRAAILVVLGIIAKSLT